MPEHLTAGAAEAAADLVLGRAAGPSGVRVLAVDGPSGSGKTTLAGAVATVLRSRGVSTSEVHMDDLYPGWDGLAESVGLVTAQVLEPLTAGAPAAFRRWDWVAHRWAEQVPVPAADVVVVEGGGVRVPSVRPAPDRPGVGGGRRRRAHAARHRARRRGVPAPLGALGGAGASAVRRGGDAGPGGPRAAHVRHPSRAGWGR
ncbi:MAG: hypothetical protein PGN11_14185 [Quadrisphaera sp.]